MSKPRGAIVESRDGPLRRLVLILRSIAGIQPLTARSWWNLKKQSFRDGFWKNPLAQEQLLRIDANINRRRKFSRNPSDIESVTITEHAALLLVWWIAYESHIRAIAASHRLPIVRLEETIHSALPAREMAKRARLAIDEVQPIRLGLTKRATRLSAIPQTNPRMVPTLKAIQIRFKNDQARRKTVTRVARELISIKRDLISSKEIRNCGLNPTTLHSASNSQAMTVMGRGTRALQYERASVIDWVEHVWVPLAPGARRHAPDVHPKART